ncbi:hypothetical protein WJX81_000597 [Elliptochloris bilobata]|uniref:Uncharacterized protein n=1 Tax=Elliptochloris bilobata TaxID=381761 RepID=A0AAW1RLM6_9CHLO
MAFVLYDATHLERCLKVLQRPDIVVASVAGVAQQPPGLRGRGAGAARVASVHLVVRRKCNAGTARWARGYAAA